MNIEFLDPHVLPYASYTLHIKDFLEQSGKSISEYKIYQPKAVDFMHYYILFFDIADVFIVNILGFMVTILT